MDIVLTFEADNIRRLDRCDFTAVLVNDSDYRLLFSFLVPSGSGWMVRWNDSLEPGTCLELAHGNVEYMAVWEKFIFQAVAFSDSGEFEAIDPFNIRGDISLENFRKERAFRNPVYSESPAMEIPLVTAGKSVRFDSPDPELLKDAMGGAPLTGLRELTAKYATDVNGKRKSSRSGLKNQNQNKVLPTIEVDLHIHELVDTTLGMDNASMLQLQLDTVRSTMKAHQRRYGQRIVFIHGKGDGVLRNAVRKLLSHEFHRCEVQDASFQRYGFGATLVIIHQ